MMTEHCSKSFHDTSANPLSLNYPLKIPEYQEKCYLLNLKTFYQKSFLLSILDFL